MDALDPVAKAFILHWGEMGSRWGINRTVAQIHALLYLSPEPMPAGQIAETLAIAKSNVSSSVHELQAWGVVKIVHVFGDRRDHFEALTNVWEMFQLIADERRKRECDPTLAALRTWVEDDGGDVYTRQRLAEMLQFYEVITRWYGQMRRVPTPSLVRLLKMGDKVLKLIEVVPRGRNRGNAKGRVKR